MLEEIDVLFQIGVPELVPGLERGRVAGLQADQLIAMLFHPAVVHRHLDCRREVDVGAGAGVGLAVGHAALGAAGHGIVVCVFEAGAFGEQHRYDFLVIAQFREAGAFLDGFGHFIKVPFRGACMNTGGQVRVVHREFAFGLQEQIGQIIGGVHAFSGLSADGNGFPVGVAFVESAAGRRDIQVDELRHPHPHAFHQFEGLLVCQRPGLLVLLIERIQILVHTAIGNDRAGFLFHTGEHLGEPLRLHRIAEITGRVFRHPGAALGDVLQFQFASRVGFLFGHFCGQLGMTLRPQHNRIAGDDDCFKERAFFHVVDRA